MCLSAYAGVALGSPLDVSIVNTVGEVFALTIKSPRLLSFESRNLNLFPLTNPCGVDESHVTVPAL